MNQAHLNTFGKCESAPEQHDYTPLKTMLDDRPGEYRLGRRLRLGRRPVSRPDEHDARDKHANSGVFDVTGIMVNKTPTPTFTYPFLNHSPQPEINRGSRKIQHTTMNKNQHRTEISAKLQLISSHLCAPFSHFFVNGPKLSYFSRRTVSTLVSFSRTTWVTFFDESNDGFFRFVYRVKKLGQTAKTDTCSHSQLSSRHSSIGGIANGSQVAKLMPVSLPGYRLQHTHSAHSNAPTHVSS
jgi:hypothetical protein